MLDFTLKKPSLSEKNSIANQIFIGYNKEILTGKSTLYFTLYDKDFKIFVCVGCLHNIRYVHYHNHTQTI